MEVATARLWRGLPFVVATAAAVVVGNVVWLLGHGFDFTDGGNSWNLLADPGASPLNVSQAGHAYQPVFTLFGHHDVVFQRANGLATVVLATVLAWVLVGTLELPARPVVAVCLALGIGSGACAALYQWQAPPNYKWLTVQGLLVAATALVARRGGVRREVLLGLVLGVGGWLTVLGKVPSGAAVGVLALAHVVASRSSWWRLAVAGATAGGLVVASALAIDGSLTRFAADLSAGADEAAALTPSHAVGALLRLDPPVWTWTTTVLLVATTVAVAVLAARAADGPDTATGVVAILLALAGAVVASTSWSWWPGFEWGRGVWVLAVPVGTAAAVGWHRRRHHADDGGTPRRRHLADVVLLLALAPAYALGSANNQWHEATRAAVFWLAAGVPLVGLLPAGVRVAGSRVGGARTRTLGVVATAVVVVTAGLVHIGARQPYHQEQGLRGMATSLSVDVPYDGGRFSVAQADYVDSLVAGAEAAGFTPGTPLLDLTGHSPGEVYLLGGDPPGRAWLIGGWSGSDQVAIDALDRAGCDVVARSWVLEHPGTRIGHVPTVPDAFGFDLRTDFRVAATATAPDGTPRRLLEPTRPEAAAVRACEQARG